MEYLSKKKVRENLLKKVKLVLLICVVTFISCVDEEEIVGNALGVNCGEGVWTNFSQDELNLWLIATQEYSNNPTIENCNAYKSAGNAYIETLEDAYKCIPTVNLTEYEEAIKEAKTEISEISCQ